MYVLPQTRSVQQAGRENSVELGGSRAGSLGPLQNSQLPTSSNLRVIPGMPDRRNLYEKHKSDDYKKIIQIISFATVIWDEFQYTWITLILYTLSLQLDIKQNLYCYKKT